jgi:hypothetical protein
MIYYCYITSVLTSADTEVYHMNTAVRHVVRAIPALNGNTDIRPSVSRQPLLLSFSFSQHLIMSLASTLTRSFMPIRQAGFKGHIADIMIV